MELAKFINYVIVFNPTLDCFRKNAFRNQQLSKILQFCCTTYFQKGNVPCQKKLGTFFESWQEKLVIEGNGALAEVNHEKLAFHLHAKGSYFLANSQ